MNLRQLQHFLLVAEERNFRRAAERAFLSQPALSHSIKALEERFDVQLFVRTRHSVSLTAVGETLLQYARKILDETQNFDDVVRYLKTGEAGHLRIGLVPTFAYSFGGRAISEWMAARPNVSLDVIYQTSQHLVSMLEQEEIDFFICDARQIRSSPEIDITPIGEYVGGLYCRKGHPILAQPTPTREDLLAYRFACVRVPAIMRDELASAFGAEGHDRPIVALECDSISVLRTTVLATDLIWISNKFVVANDISDGRLVEIASDFSYRIHWGIAKRRDRVLPPAALPLMKAFSELPNDEP